MVLILKYRHKVFFAKSRKRGFSNLHFWIRGYCVSTVGIDEEKVRKYFREQEKKDRDHQGQQYLEINDEF